ncbi:ClpP/crotonase [Cristinia sonorae]|uniref:ClpP/crotonase n=1 Tax=Cristinia sonorae TaxID=1940300 RepID=A0A8K0XQB5_9AGAR|nr:ClpP/crotonase [Cristinia sonorae]
MAFPLKFPANEKTSLLTVTHPKPSLWVIEMHNGADSRLSTTFLAECLMPALDAVERDWRKGLKVGPATHDAKGKEGGRGALIIVGNRSQDKFFSNGLDFDNLTKQPDYATNFFPVVFNPVMRRLLTYPVPVIAALNGHTFAGGFMLALCCDFRVMVDGKKRNAWLCMNEIHFGAALPASFTALARNKCAGPLGRKIFLEGHRFTPTEALEVGLVDYIAGNSTASVLAKAEEVAAGVEHLAQFGGFGIIKRELYRDVLEISSKDLILSNAVADNEAAKARL